MVQIKIRVSVRPKKKEEAQMLLLWSVTHLKCSACHLTLVTFANCTTYRQFLVRMAAVKEDLFKKKKRSVWGVRCLFTCAKMFDPAGPLNKFKCFPGRHQSQHFHHSLQMDLQPLKADWLRASALPAAWLCRLAACSIQTACHFLCVLGWSESTAWTGTQRDVNASNVTNHGWWGCKDQQVWFIRRLAVLSLASSAFSSLAPSTALTKL